MKERLGREEVLGIIAEARANLERADLERANLRGANLSGANLAGTDLREANLERADLRGANLAGTDLVGATLWRADLNGANLERANLWRANLNGADLGGASLVGAYLCDTDVYIFQLGRDFGFAHFGEQYRGGSYIRIGCEGHSLDHWLANYREIGSVAGYAKDDIEIYGDLLHLLQKRKFRYG